MGGLSFGAVVFHLHLSLDLSIGLYPFVLDKTAKVRENRYRARWELDAIRSLYRARHGPGVN